MELLYSPYSVWAFFWILSGHAVSRVPDKPMVMSRPGGKPQPECSHPYIRKGYYLGLPDEVYVCVSCGEQRLKSQWENFESRRKPPSMLSEQR
jgi:hypothetical protein